MSIKKMAQDIRPNDRIKVSGLVKKVEKVMEMEKVPTILIYFHDWDTTNMVKIICVLECEKIQMIETRKT